MSIKALNNINDIDQLKKIIFEKDEIISNKNKLLTKKESRIESLEEQLRSLQQQRFGRQSEKFNPDQLQLQFFNEVELIVDSLPEKEQSTDVKGHTRKKAKPRQLPKDLPRVQVLHELPESDRQCDCGKTLQPFSEETTEQLGIVPQQFYIIEHRKVKYACDCKQCIKTAPLPKQPLPKSQASPQLLSHIMVSKFLDGLPLYRQEKMALRNGFDFPRAKLARWLIVGAQLLQPLYNLIEEILLNYDIILSDETGIQVLKEPDKRPESKSYLWIRRGGPPNKPVVTVDYDPSRSGSVATRLLEPFKGYLVADAYAGYDAVLEKTDSKLVACNDHARRKFAEIIKINKQSTKLWIANKAITYYKALYKIEKKIKPLPVEQKKEIRQKESLKIWIEFYVWLKKIHEQGILHEKTRKAVEYMLRLEKQLQRYCEDGRLPISNIASEHVAKTIAVSRKNFLFADTQAGARASGLIYSILETAKANSLHPHHYMTVLMAELPKCQSLEDYEALLPWQFTSESLKHKFDQYPSL